MCRSRSLQKHIRVLEATSVKTSVLLKDGYIANVVSDKIKSDQDMSATEIMKWLMTTYNVDMLYMRAYRGKEQAYTYMYGKWGHNSMRMAVFRLT